jgi:hypothetical protein
MPDSPIQAKFLDEEDKLLAIERYIMVIVCLLCSVLTETGLDFV